MYKNSLVHHITKILVDIMFYVGIIATLTVPFWGNTLGYLFISGDETVTSLTFILVCSGACCVYILYNIKRMFKTLLGGNPFVEENVVSFRKISIGCSAVALIYAAKCIFMPTLATLIIALIFIVGTLFCLTLKDIFKQAVNYKQENDLTI